MACIYTAKYLFPGDAPPIVGGALLAHQGLIKAVGELAGLKRSHPGVEIIDFGESLLVPVLVNAHTHLELTDYPQWAEKLGETGDPQSFVDWILRLIRIKRSVDKEQFEAAIVAGIEQSIASGTGAVADIISHYSARRGYQDAPLLGTLYLESLGQDPAVIQRARKRLQEVLQEERAGQLTLGISPHAPYSISSTYLENLYEICREQGLRCSTHLAESAEEVEFIEKSRGELITGFYLTVGWEALVPRAAGCSPTEYLRQRGGLFRDNLLAHGVQLCPAEIELLAKNSMSVALCPRSNARLRVGKAPVAELLTRGVGLALGTDSMASNDSLSIWDEMAFAYRWFEGQLDAPSLFRIATMGGAEALGLTEQLGSLAIGKQCSFQVLRSGEQFSPTELAEFLIAPGRSKEIVQVYLQGKAQLAENNRVARASAVCGGKRD